MYIDGQGMRMKGRRWQRYCRKCYGRYKSNFIIVNTSILYYLTTHFSTILLYLPILTICKTIGNRSLLSQNPLQHLIA